MPVIDHHKDEAGLFPRKNFLPFFLVTALFLFWGIPNNLNDILIRQFMKSFELSRLQAGLVQSAFYLGYFLLAIPAAMVMKRFSYKTGLLTGMILYSCGCLLFWPAALVGKFSFFLLALFVIAAGLSFLETGANPFIAGLGDPRTAARRLNLSQAFNPVGAIGGVIIGTLFIFSGIEHDADSIRLMKAAGTYEHYLQTETMRVVTPYIVLGCLVLLWAVLIFKTKFPDQRTEEAERGESGTGFSHLVRIRHFRNGVLSQFCYIGAQVGTWSYFIPYILDYTGANEKQAGYLLSGTLVAFGIGRFVATAVMKFLEPSRLMGIYSLINIFLVLMAVCFPGWVGVGSIFLTSFFMSLMFPTIFALSIRGLGDNTKLGGSIIVMAIIGGAVFTPVMGILSDKTGSMALSMLVPLGCYFVVTWFAFKGSVASYETATEEIAAGFTSH